MSIWDPHTYKPGGAPIGPVAPAALRVHGVPASEGQLGMAQAAFYRFCMQARVSRVPNPAEAGRLPDGTAYRIVRVGNTTTMEIWPEDTANDRLSGIGITLVDLQGNLVPGHIHSNGTNPQPYILTPEARPGSRRSTGRWRVLKVNSYSGGKAVFQTPLYDLYLTGVDGVPTFFQLPPPPNFSALGGTNMRAYRYGSYGRGSSIYGQRRPVAQFRSGAEPLPFFRKRGDGTLWIMQAVAKYDGQQRIELWGQPYRPPGGPVGDLLATLPIPANHTVNWDSLSASPDGKRLRAVFIVTGGNFKLVDIAVGDASLSITSMVERGYFIPGYEQSHNSGTPELPDAAGIRVGDISYGNAAYGFDGRGEEYESLLGGGGRTENWTYRETFSSVEIGTDPVLGPILLQNEGLYSTTSMSYPGGRVKLNGRDIVFPGLSGQSNSQSLVTRTTVDNKTLTYTASGFIHDWVESWDKIEVLYFDPTTEFVVIVQKIHREDYNAQIVPMQTPDGGWFAQAVPPRETGTVVSSYGSVMVQCRGETIATIDISHNETDYFAVSAAADPWTGAIFANLMEYTTANRTVVRRSWIFIADDAGARELGAVMKLPTDNSVRVRTDESLISV